MIEIACPYGDISEHLIKMRLRLLLPKALLVHCTQIICGEYKEKKRNNAKYAINNS